QARDVAGPAVERDVAVRHQLAGGSPVGRETEPMHHIIQPAFHEGQEHLAGVLRRARRQLEVTAELALKMSVEAFELLLLAQPDACLARLAAAIAVHSGSDVAPLDGALGAFATAALEEQLDAFASAQFANRIDRACHYSLARLSFV